MVIQIYLNFNGNCHEAVNFYGKVFGAEPHIMTFGQMPPSENFPITEEMKKLVLHARLDFSGNQMMFSDVIPGMEFICGNNITITLASDNKEELIKWFNGLAEGGNVGMPIGETFWSKLYGAVTDKYGIGWQVNYIEQ